MARPPRLAVAGVALHVIQRGNDRQSCFRVDSDYLVYLHQLRQASARAHCDIHAYCLMTNHVHLLLTPREASSCGDLMRELGRGYVRYFNDRHGRTGTLWEGRFRSCLVDSAAYVLACYRYIELNPVRANIVREPSGYRWSSYGVNVGMGTDPLIVPHAEYVAISSDVRRRHAAYRDLVEEGDRSAFLEQIRAATSSGHGLVGDRVKTRVAAMGRSLERGKSGPRPRLAALDQPANEELLP